MNQPLIGLVGPQGSGKTTVAAELEEKFNYGIYSFADPLKNMLCSLLDCDYEELENAKREDEKLPRYGSKTVRELMQSLGTEWGRKQVSKDLWVSVLERDLGDDPEPIVIHDLRFQNEADMVLRRGGILVEVYRKGYDWKLDHGSEMGHLIPTSYRIDNSSSLKDLAANCLALHAWALKCAGEQG